MCSFVLMTMLNLNGLILVTKLEKIYAFFRQKTYRSAPTFGLWSVPTRTTVRINLYRSAFPIVSHTYRKCLKTHQSS